MWRLLLLGCCLSLYTVFAASTQKPDEEYITEQPIMRARIPGVNAHKIPRPQLNISLISPKKPGRERNIFVAAASVTIILCLAVILVLIVLAAVIKHSFGRMCADAK
ncbi:hypothetical protein C0J52_03279 [Blattella germanica]|nr:hypothetical protein C0J52_03279 [Blattella germanica]